MRSLDSYLLWMAESDASDLYLVPGRPPVIKVKARFLEAQEDPVKPEEMDAIVKAVCDERQRSEFEITQEMNLAYSSPNLGRFRINLYKQRGAVGMVVRFVKSVIPSFEELGLPNTLGDLAMRKRGLVLITGPAGSGKSTTLAAMIDYRNTNSEGHIITIEDPIEFIHQHKKSIVSQREVGIDTETFASALRNVLRQAPDVILIGEMRDTETVEAAISFAETGHLVLSTLHSSNTQQALERILSFFPLDTHNQIFQLLSMELAAIVGLRLVRRADGQGLIPAYEIMLATPRIRELIEKGQITGIRAAMSASLKEGNMTFDECLYRLCKQGLITEQEAMRWPDSKTNLRLRFKMEKAKEEQQTGAARGHRPAGLRISRRP